MKKRGYRTFLIAVIFAAVIGAGYHGWSSIATTGSFERLASGDGRIEAAEITVTSVAAGRLEAVLVHEGQVVRAGQVLARVEVDCLMAEHREALARHREALYAQALAETEVMLLETEVRAAEKAVRHCDEEFNTARSRSSRLPHHSRRLPELHATRRTGCAASRLGSIRDLVQSQAAQLTAGLLGVAWVKLDAQLPWPPALALTSIR